MEILLTILSVISLWAFLTVLIIGLLLIIKTLESVRLKMQKIAMGVRAIETQLIPLADSTDTLNRSLEKAGNAAGRAASGMSGIEAGLNTVSQEIRS